MGKSYSQGLAVTDSMIVRQQRILPLKGEVKASEGDTVKAEDVVAVTMLPGKVVPLNLANKLGVTPDMVGNFLMVKEGDMITKGQVLAQTKGFMGMFKTAVKSPTDGEIESVSRHTGQALLREPRNPIEVRAFIDGIVVEVIPEEGVVVENRSAYIQGIFGIGNEITGEIACFISSPEEILTPDRIDESHKDKIIVSGELIPYESVKKAIEVGVKGIITGGINDQDLKKLLGYDIGVAITGHENVGITLVVTEGFGNIRMAQHTFDLLNKYNGHRTSMHGKTQIRAGVIRPEIIIPKAVTTASDGHDEAELPFLEVGKTIRVIRQPNFGKIGKVVAMPEEPKVVESETKVRILEAELEDGNCVLIPRANVEIIAE
ncbi:MAG: hypothetical protein K8R90_03950 [Candidatus Cloacimonetes bacterium]|nr:hypothetical protein [Candidatus Cloacimonadota bacterium]